MVKSTQKGAIAGVTGIGLGLMILFGGVDIPTLAAITSLWALIVAIVQGGILEVIKGVLKRPFSSMFFIAAVVYLVLTRINQTEVLNETARSLLVGVLFLPFLSWAFMTGNEEDKKIAGRGLIAGFVFAAVLLSYEAVSGYRLYHLAVPHQDPQEMERNLGRGAYILIIMLFPVLLTIKAQHLDTKLKIFVIVAAIFLSTRFGIDLNIITIAVAGIVYGLALVFPRVAIISVNLVASVLIAFAPFIYEPIAKFAKSLWTPDTIPLSYGRRADMWLYAIDRIKEKPIWGWGLDAAKTFNQPIKWRGFDWTVLQMHPHSAPLNLWLEGGAVGALLFVIAINFGSIWLLRSVGKNRDLAATISASLTAIIFGWAVTYGAWQQWLWICLFFAIIYPFLNNMPKQRSKKASEELQEIV